MNLETYLYDSLHEFDVCITIEGNPGVKIIVNGVEKFNQIADSGKHLVNFTTNLEKYEAGYIQIEMYGKSDRDTVFQNGKILKDVSVTIDDIVVNGVSFTKTGHIYSGIYKPVYWNNYAGDTPETMPGARTLGFNGVWTYKWEESPVRNIINCFEKVELNSINDQIQEIFSALNIR
jgi:hypothetical protein